MCIVNILSHSPFLASQKPKYNNLSLDDLREEMPARWWLEKNKHILALKVHRTNNEFTKKVMQESAVTVAAQKKAKASATEKECSAVKERAIQLAKAVAVSRLDVRPLTDPRT